MPRVSQELGVVPWKSRDDQELVQQFRRCALHIDTGLNSLLLHLYCSWQKVASVLLELKGMDYLIAFDWFSRYVKVAAMEKNNKVNWDHRGTEGHICHTVQEILEKVWSEQVFQFDKSEFTNFSKE